MNQGQYSNQYQNKIKQKKHTCKLKLHQKIRDEDIADEIFCSSSQYQSISYSLNYLLGPNQAKNEKLVNNTNDAFIDSRIPAIKKYIPENENPKTIINIVEEIIDFDNQQKGKGLKILTPKKITNSTRTSKTT